MLARRLSDNYRYTSTGAMRDQITLLMPNPVPLPDGSPGTPVVFAENVWCNIQMQRTPQEINSTELVQSEVFWWVTMHYMPGVNSQMTVLTGAGAVWFIVSVATDPRQIETKILCRSVNDGGSE
jgi:hypothetical protein